MKSKAVKQIISGSIFIALFVIWTMLIQTIDVKPVGINETNIGFATLNVWLHSLIGVNMTLYNITDWLGLVPVSVCMFFGMVGLVQLIKRKSLIKVDFDIVVLGVYYVIVILCYLIFEMIPINYRPVLINGFMEASYPSSTTLLVLCVMPTLSSRIKSKVIKKIVCVVAILFMVFMVIGRLISGVHWITDIIGSIFLSAGLYYIYSAMIHLKKI